jgi:hypothetical protein
MLIKSIGNWNISDVESKRIRVYIKRDDVVIAETISVL